MGISQRDLASPCQPQPEIESITLFAFFVELKEKKTKPMAFSVANMQNMGLLIPISMCGYKQDSVFFIRRHDKETYGYSIF
jgi:hypothetical protein